MDSTATSQAMDPRDTARRGWSYRVAVPALLLLIVIGFYWRLVLTSQYDWVWGPDLALQVMPWLEEESRQVNDGQFPLWDPHTWAGQPFVGQAQPGTAYPFNWILFAWPREDGHISRTALQWYYVLMHYMAALFAYLLCRDLGRSRGASLIAAIVFSLGGYISAVGWPQMLNGAVWAPLVFLFLFRMVRGVSPVASAALCGLCLGISWLSGHHQAPTYLTLACCGVWVFYIFREGSPRWRLAGFAALALFIAGLVGALQIVPATEYGQLARRWAGAANTLAWDESVPYYVHARYSLLPRALLGLVFPGGMSAYVDPFIGVTAFTLAIAAVAVCWRDRAVRLLTALALAGALFALGSFNVFHGMLYAIVPMLEKSRAAAMAVFGFDCAAAALAAFAVDEFLAAPQSIWVRRAARGAAVFGAAVLFLILGVLFANKIAWNLDDRIPMAPVAALLLAALLYGWRSGAFTRRQFVWLTTALVLIEVGVASSYSLADRFDASRTHFLDSVKSDEDVATFLRTLPKPFRIDSEPDLATNWGEYHNFGFLKAFTPSVTQNLSVLEFHTQQTKRLFGVRYTIARKSPSPDVKDLFTSATRLHVYEDPGAFPRAWTVRELLHVSRPEEGRAFISSRLEELRTKALYAGAPRQFGGCGTPDRVEFKTYRPSKVVVAAQMSCPGMLVLSDTFYPGWRAFVDGRATPITEVNFGMRAVELPAGSHEVKFSYRPVSVYLGAGLTLFGIALASGLAFVFRGSKTGG